jgi:hypothetical protein
MLDTARAIKPSTTILIKCFMATSRSRPGTLLRNNFPTSAFNADIRKIESDWLTMWDFS